MRLLEDGATVGAVVHEVSYRSVSAFGQACARQFGRSPTGRAGDAGVLVASSG